MKDKCEAKNCNNTAKTRCLCIKHYTRLVTGLDINEPTYKDKRPATIKDGLAYLPIGLKAKNGYAIVDEKYAHLDKYSWSLSEGYPCTRTEDKKKTRLHHLIMGKPPKGMVIDHINREKLDNTESNLRMVAHRTNIINTGMFKHNTSGFKGVYKKGEKWVANICVNKKTIALGTYTELAGAIEARRLAELKYWSNLA